MPKRRLPHLEEIETNLANALDNAPTLYDRPESLSTIEDRDVEVDCEDQDDARPLTMGDLKHLRLALHRDKRDNRLDVSIWLGDKKLCEDSLYLPDLEDLM